MIPWYFSFDETRRLPELVEGAAPSGNNEQDGRGAGGGGGD
eukprot:COSAG03_NODE_7893_length_859_cov_1.135526_1_plen_40_part_10